MKPAPSKFLRWMTVTVALLGLACLVDQDAVSPILAILAILVGVPMIIVSYLDYVRSRRARELAAGSSRVVTRVLSTPVVLLGVVSLAFGLAMVVWVLYNLLIERQPQFSQATFLPTLGVGPVLIVFGIQCMRRPAELS